MAASDLLIPTDDGDAAATLHVPDGEGPWPGVLLYPDAGGVRPVFRTMGDRLAGLGFVALVPDIYFRDAGYEPFSMDTAFTDPDERQRLRTLVTSLTPDRVASDAAAFAAALSARPEVAPGPIGTTGYCLGGRLSLTAAGRLGAVVGAAASFHGGGLAVEDDPASPHHLAASVAATVYVGMARDDASFDDEQAARLEAAYAAAGVALTVERYDAPHGFAVPDNPPYDEAAAERHWQATAALFDGALR